MYAATPAKVMTQPAALHALSSFPNINREMPIDMTTFTLPNTWSVTADVYLVTRKFIKFNRKATKPEKKIIPHSDAARPPTSIGSCSAWYSKSTCMTSRRVRCERVAAVRVGFTEYTPRGTIELQDKW